MLIVLTTTPGLGEAGPLAKKIVESGLAACVQIVPQISSVYVLEGEIQNENEQLLLIKTVEEKYSELEKFITDEHSYDVPEIVAVKIENVSESYRGWLYQTLLKQ